MSDEGEVLIRFPEVEIPPFGIVNLEALIDPDMQVFQGEKIIADELIIGSTTITDYRIGDRRQLLPVKTMSLNTGHPGGPYKLGLWTRGERNRIVVRNDMSNKVKWSARVIGKAVRG